MCDVLATFDYKLNCIKHLRVMALDLVIRYCIFYNTLRKKTTKNESPRVSILVISGPIIDN